MPPAQPTPNPTGQYDFIMQNAQQPQRNLMPGGRRQLIVMLSIGAGVVVALIIIGSLVLGGKKDAATEIIAAISTEQELARISNLASTKATDPNTRALAATTNAVLSSDAQILKAYLKTSGQKVAAKQLVSTSAKTDDAALNNASEENHFDDAYLALLAAKLKPYQTSLNTAYQAAGPKGKPVLKTAYDNSKLISTASLLSATSQADSL